MNDRKQSELPEAVTVSRMAEMCGLSRQRFHELIGTVFPYPVYKVSNHRPIYVREQIEVCLEVRRIGKAYYTSEPVIFYQRKKRGQRRKLVTNQTSENGRYEDLVAGLRSLGLTDVDEGRVADAIRELHPTGNENVEFGEVLREVFLHLKRQKSA